MREMDKKNLISLLIYTLALLLSMAFVFWVSEVAFWDSSIELNGQFVEIRADEVAANIRTSIRYGKSLANYFGIEHELSQITELDRECIGACVADSDGEIVAGVFPEDETVSRDMLASLYSYQEKNGSAQSGAFKFGVYNGFMYRMENSRGEDTGALIVIYNGRGIARYKLDTSKFIPFMGIFLTAVIGLTLFVFGQKKQTGEGALKLRRNIPIVIIMLTVLLFVVYLFFGFRAAYAELIMENADKTGDFLQTTVDDLLDKGLPVDELDRLQEYYDGIAERNEALSAITIRKDGRVMTVSSWSYVTDKIRFLAATFGAIFAVCLMIMYELTGFVAALTEAGQEQTAASGSTKKVPVKIRSVIRVLSFVLYTAIYASMPYAAVIMRQNSDQVFGFSTALSASLPLTVELIVILLTTMAVQKLCADEKPQKLFIIAVAILVFGNAACLRVDSPYLLILLRAFCGIGFAFLKYFFNAVISMGSKKVEDIEQNFANMNAGLLGGITIGSSLGSILAGTFGYQGNYLFTAVVILAVTLPGVLLLQDYKSVGKKAGAQENSGGVSLLSVLSNKKLLKAMILTDIPLNIGLMYIVAFLPVYMGVIGKPAIATGYAYLINGVCGIYVGVFLVGFLKKLSGEKAVILSICTAAAGILCLLLGTQVYVVILSAAILGIFDGYGTPSMTGYFAKAAAQEGMDGKGILTIYGSIGSAVQIICPALYGLLAQPDGNLMPVLIFGLVFLLFGFVFAWEVRHEK